MPHEILETLAHTNYLSPRPRQTDPGVLFDLLKIRKLVDEASDLAVRAQNGTASSALANADNGLPGSALGLSYKGGGGNAKLSPERKYRMRELATQKLSQAYRLDEVAASVATMQSASTLDTVASLVLQRSPGNIDAKYVHFFHEKIPSRMMAECTPLTPLDDIIAFEPGHAAPFRTRALTRIFKEDYTGAIRDLTEALALCRLEQAKHSTGRNQLVTMQTAREESERRKMWTRDWMHENKVSDEDQPKGLEMQLLFQRGNLYLTVAGQYVRFALEHFRLAQRLQEQAMQKQHPNGDDPPLVKSSEEMEAYRRGLDAREIVRKNAKKALRDYTAFFSRLDYAHAPPIDSGHASHKSNGTTEDACSSQTDTKTASSEETGHSKALTRLIPDRYRQREDSRGRGRSWSPSPEPTVYDVATILSSSPPSDLPPFPPSVSSALSTRSSVLASPSLPPHIEMVTYHPLLPEALHSFLLTHCLLQTPRTTLLRLANNVARLARLAEGYPFFLSARSPARADWSEVVRKTGNWIGLDSNWEALCRVPTSSDADGLSETQDRPAKEVSKRGTAKSNEKAEAQSQEQKRDRIHKEAVMEALGDERVVDDDTFQRAVKAHEKRAWRDIEAAERGTPPPSTVNGHVNETNGKSPAEPLGRGRAKGIVAKDEEYLIGTERAEAIARWVLEAPIVVDTTVAGLVKKKRKKGPLARIKHELGIQHEGPSVEPNGRSLEHGMHGLELSTEDEK